MIYQEGRGAETFEAAVRSLRKGEALAVRHVSDLAKNRDELRERIKAVHAKKSYVLETATGRASNNPDDLAEMIFDAADNLGQRRKGLDSKRASEYGSRGGKPPIPWTAAQRAMIESHWYNTKLFATNAEAVAAMNAALEKDECEHRVSGANYVWRMMKDKYGAEKAGSGRVTGPRKRIVAKLRKR